MLDRLKKNPFKPKPDDAAALCIVLLILESILDPSKVISYHYRSLSITLFDGRTFIGLAAEQNGMLTVLLQDASKIVLKSSDVESCFASLASVMPEKLLDELTKEEIADLFAYLDSGG